jgi:hypothetical protein
MDKANKKLDEIQHELRQRHLDINTSECKMEEIMDYFANSFSVVREAITPPGVKNIIKKIEEHYKTIGKFPLKDNSVKDNSVEGEIFYNDRAEEFYYNNLDGQKVIVASFQKVQGGTFYFKDDLSLEIVRLLTMFIQSKARILRTSDVLSTDDKTTDDD